MPASCIRLSAARLAVCAGLALSAVVPPAFAESVVDYLAVPGPVKIGGTEYKLAWTSRPAPNYIKQEYVPAGENVEHYNNMVLVELLTDARVAQSLSRQMRMIQERKKTDPAANMALFNDGPGGQMVLDFVMSAKLPSGEDVVEWNAYRYAPHENGTLLLGTSQRAYGKEAQAFLKDGKHKRFTVMKALVDAPLPKVSVRD